MPFEFTQESFSDFTTQVLAANGDQATLTSILADMQGVYTDQLGIAAKQQQDMTRISEENERLKKANMDLFLRVGEQAQTKQQTQQLQEEEKEEDVDTYLSRVLEDK